MKKVIDLVIRDLRISDMDAYESLTHPSKEYHKYNGPYYKHDNEEEHIESMKKIKEKLESDDKNLESNRKIIVDNESNEIIGAVSWYWKSEETNWLEVGVVIFNENYWGYGIGYKSLKLWINMVFETKPELVRIGLTTWSGNNRMINLAEKLGLKKEAEYRNARVVDGIYYDSVSYGILKNEWEQIANK